MKTKFIVASTIGLLGIAAVMLGATTFAANTGVNKTTGRGSGTHITRDRDDIMQKFMNTGDAQAFRTAVHEAISTSNYNAFVAAYTKYNITNKTTQEQFTTMATERATQEKSLTALKSGDYITWKTLNKDNPLLSKIDTQTKFQKLQEIELYGEKIAAINKDLGLGELKGEGNDELGMRYHMGKGMEKGLRGGMGRHEWPRNGSGTSQ